MRTVGGVVVKTFRRRLIATAALLTLAACGSHPPKTGTVTSMQFIPAHTDIYPMTFCTGSGSSFQCHVVMTPIYYADEWQICLRGDKPDSHGHVRKGCVDVDQTTFHGYAVGDHYPKASAR